MGQLLSGMDAHEEMSPTMLRNDTNMVIFENIDHDGEYGEYGVPDVASAYPMAVAPAPPALADPADAAIAPPPAPADPAPIPTGTILARVYGTDEEDPMVDAEVHAHIQDVQLEGEVLVVNTSTLTSTRTAVVLSAAAAPPRDAVVAPPHDLVVVSPAGANPMELSMSTQEHFTSGSVLAPGPVLAIEADESEKICRDPDDKLDVKAKLGETGHQEAGVTNPALSITSNQALDAVELGVNVTAQDVNVMQQIGAPAGVDNTYTATCVPFVVPQSAGTAGEMLHVPPSAEFTISFPSKMVAPALEATSHPKLAREEKDREDVEVRSVSVKHGSPDQKRSHLAEKKDPSQSSNDGSSYSGSSI